jgi:hypothetical protein
MCLLYTTVKNYQHHKWKKKEKSVKKHTQFNEKLMKPDINFIDKRVKKREKVENFFTKFLNMFE